MRFGVFYELQLPKPWSEDDEALPPPLNRMLAGLFAWERHLIGRVPLPAGVSLLMLARRPGP